MIIVELVSTNSPAPVRPGYILKKCKKNCKIILDFFTPLHIITARTPPQNTMKAHSMYETHAMQFALEHIDSILATYPEK